MLVAYGDFNSAEEYFETAGKSEWTDIEAIVRALPLYLQSSDQEGKKGRPIFDPKATNRHLTNAAHLLGWNTIPVPADLTAFGVDWDAGKRASLAEWQFSNYPFLWNNIIRTEAVYKSRLVLPNMQPIRALIQVTKGGFVPSSNSTLYYEQAYQQVKSATGYGAFSIPIRLVGFSIPEVDTEMTVLWTTYKNPRYDRVPLKTEPRTVKLTWKKSKKFGHACARFKFAE